MLKDSNLGENISNEDILKSKKKLKRAEKELESKIRNAQYQRKFRLAVKKKIALL